MSRTFSGLVLLAALGLTNQPAAGQSANRAADGAAGNESSKPIARTEAGGYELEVRYIGQADPDQFQAEFEPDISLPKPTAEDLSGDRQTVRKKTGKGAAAAEGASGGFGAGTGGGASGKYLQPNLVLGIRVVSAKNKKPVTDCCMSAGYRLTDASGEKSEATFTSDFRARYPLEDAALAPLPVYVPSVASGAIRELEGTLVITPQTTETIAFTPDDLRRKARKAAGKHAVQIDSVGKNGDQIELVLSVSAPAPEMAATGNFADFVARSAAMMEQSIGTSVDVYVEDSAGKRHMPKTKGVQGGGGSSGGSSSATVVIGGERTTARRKPAAAGPTQKITCAFDPLGDGVSTKQVVCAIRTAAGKTSHVPFRFAEIPLSLSQAK